MAEPIDLAEYRRKIEAEPLVRGTERWKRAMRELDSIIGPAGGDYPGGTAA